MKKIKEKINSGIHNDTLLFCFVIIVVVLLIIFLWEDRTEEISEIEANIKQSQTK